MHQFPFQLVHDGLGYRLSGFCVQAFVLAPAAGVADILATVTLPLCLFSVVNIHICPFYFSPCAISQYPANGLDTYILVVVLAKQLHCSLASAK